MLKMLLRQQVICNPCCPFVVGCLIYSVLISLVGNYHDGHLIELTSLPFVLGADKIIKVTQMCLK